MDEYALVVEMEALLAKGALLKTTLRKAYGCFSKGEEVQVDFSPIYKEDAVAAEGIYVELRSVKSPPREARLPVIGAVAYLEIIFKE